MSRLRYVGQTLRGPESYDPVARLVQRHQARYDRRTWGVLLAGFTRDEAHKGLYLPDAPPLDTSRSSLSTYYNSYTFLNAAFFATSPPVTAPELTPKVEPEFELNLTAALVGWKVWSWHPGLGRLTTIHDTVWPPDAPLVAACRSDRPDNHPTVPAPCLSCACGIYAADVYPADDGVDDSDVLGEVAGWGRYVRGEGGWRAQFAYPRHLYLTHRQAHLVEALKIYHVPISVQPAREYERVYDPREDGYEDREDDALWGGGAAAEPGAGAEDG